MRRSGLVLLVCWGLVALLPALLAVTLAPRALGGPAPHPRSTQASEMAVWELPTAGGCLAIWVARDGAPVPELRERRLSRKNVVEQLAQKLTTWGDKDGGAWVDRRPDRVAWQQGGTTAAEACALWCRFLL